jgi:hypothetical protein
MSKKIALNIIIISFLAFAAFMMLGCTTLGISFETEYGKFTYELPEPKGTKK